MKLFNKVAIIGVGLVGGSIGLGLKKRRLADKVVGICAHKSSVNKAKKLHAIDEGFLDAKKAVEGADLVILAMPISKIISLSKKISPYIKKGAIITDVGSTKVLVVKLLEKIFSQKIFFVGAHPLAGSEKKGVSHAREDLFKDAVSIVTRTNRTNKRALDKISKLWNLLGAKVAIMEPEMHDRVLAVVSHLPHIVAGALILSVDKKEINFGAGGLRDTTRIASSDPLIWRDIFLTNRKEVLVAIAKFRKQLDKLSCNIRKDESGALLSLLNKAKQKRNSLETYNV